MQQEKNLKLVENIIPEDAEKDDHPVESGEWLCQVLQVIDEQ